MYYVLWLGIISIMFAVNRTLTIEIVYHTSVRTRLEPTGAHKMLDSYWFNPFDIYSITYVRNKFYKKRIFIENIMLEAYVDGTMILLYHNNIYTK